MRGRDQVVGDLVTWVLQANMKVVAYASALRLMKLLVGDERSHEYPDCAEIQALASELGR